MSKFYAKGLQFGCTQCGHCCRHDPGYVFLSERDVEQAVRFLSLSEKEFLEKYCTIVDIGFFKKVSLREKSNYDCIFWQDGVGCSIYEARPLQCRSYPFWPSVTESAESWAAEAKECPGMNQGPRHSKAQIQEWLDKREREKSYEP